MSQNGKERRRAPMVVVPAAYFLIEVYAFAFLRGAPGNTILPWPLAFGAIWAIALTGIVFAMPFKAGRVFFGITFFLGEIYAAVQTGYFHLFHGMMWLSDFRYASEGADYFDVLLGYPISWWIWLVGLAVIGIGTVAFFPKRKSGWQRTVIAAATAVIAVAGAILLPEAVFLHDRTIRYAVSDYGRAQSAEAAYENMFNPYRLYQVCGLYQMAGKDFAENIVYPMTPTYRAGQEAARKEIDAYFDARGERQDNHMTGVFQGKNVVLVLMESMDDWAIGEHTPTICRLMREGINFTNFYTPPYGSVRTFNSEFCMNTGSFLSSRGGYAFDYVTNDFRQSLASQLTDLGYSAKVYHYNDPSFYSRGVFSPAMGYGEYVFYGDYTENERELYDDLFLFDNDQVCDSFFRDGQTLNFIITRSAHLSYVYNEVLSFWGLQKYPQYRGMTGDEEEDCMYLKARLVDDMFDRLLRELEEHGQLDNTVIVAMTDHYTYGIKDESLILERSGIQDILQAERTPCFIWSADGPTMEVDKTLNTSDLLPTVLNMLGIDSPYSYLGQDAFDSRYPGYAFFPNGSWASDGILCKVSGTTQQYFFSDGERLVDPDMAKDMAERLSEYVRINNLILETDYYNLD